MGWIQLEFLTPPSFCFTWAYFTLYAVYNIASRPFLLSYFLSSPILSVEKSMFSFSLSNSPQFPPIHITSHHHPYLNALPILLLPLQPAAQQPHHTGVLRRLTTSALHPSRRTTSREALYIHCRAKTSWHMWHVRITIRVIIACNVRFVDCERLWNVAHEGWCSLGVVVV